MTFQFSQIKAPEFVKDEYSWCESVYVFALKKDFVPYPKGFFVCQSGLGEDYHKILTDFMTDFAKENIKEKYEIICDKNLDEKKLAIMAGVGKISKNNLIYSQVLKSFVYIGEILSAEKCEISPIKEKKYNLLCENCNICEKACPGKAIKNWNYNKENCISFITQKKDDLTETERSKINSLYGCDACTLCCPLTENYNEKEIFPINLEYLCNITNKEFNSIKKDYPFMWMGKKRISRNAKILLAKKEKKC